MSDIVLSAGVRSNLLQLQQTSNLINTTQTDLATGKKVNSALDNAISFFTAQGLNTRANNLNSLLDSMSNGVNTIQAANNGITAITKLVQSAQALVSQAQQANNTTTQATLATQFDSLLTQIGQLAGDSGYNGVNLLAGNTLSVTLDETGNSTISVTGVDYTNASAGPLSIAAAANNWASSTDISAASTALSAALTSLQSESQTLSSSLSTVQIRQDFTSAMVNTLQTGADNLTLADSNQEGANLLALQTRQQLSTTALSLAAQSDQNVLKLFQG
jgi:flagellin